MAGHFQKKLFQNGLLSPNHEYPARTDWPPAPPYFPHDDPEVSGFHRPIGFQGGINNLEISGEIPRQINGTFYRIMPEPQFPAFKGGNLWFNGDGNLSAFRIFDGHVDFKQRYVQTEKFVREAEARRALLGKYRNKYTDLVEVQVRSTANTNIVYWNGVLLALKEDSPPYAVDPETLETIGLYDFEGQLPCLKFTAHPKFDPITRELVCFGYAAKGDATNDVCYYTFDKAGRIQEEVWLESPVAGMIHDFAVTEHYVLFPMINQIADLDRLKAGGDHFQWDNTLPTYIGVLPRRGAKGTDVKWFQAPHGFAGHCANAFEDENGLINLQIAYAIDNYFFWWPDKDGKAPNPGECETWLCNFKIDYHSDKLDLGPPEYFVEGEEVEFPKIDERRSMFPSSRIFACAMDKTKATDMAYIGPRMGAGHPVYNCIVSYDVQTKQYRKYFAGPRKLCQECVFIPRGPDVPEGDGWVMMLLNNYESMCSELAIVDTRDMSSEVALVKLPIRLRMGVHGNWVDSADTDGHPPALQI